MTTYGPPGTSAPTAVPMSIPVNPDSSPIQRVITSSGRMTWVIAARAIPNTSIRETERSSIRLVRLPCLSPASPCFRTTSAAVSATRPASR